MKEFIRVKTQVQNRTFNLRPGHYIAERIDFREDSTRFRIGNNTYAIPNEDYELHIEVRITTISYDSWTEGVPSIGFMKGDVIAVVEPYGKHYMMCFHERYGWVRLDNDCIE